MKKKLNKIILFALILPLSLSVFTVGQTKAYYNDTESSTGNSFSAAFLDFILTNNNLNKQIGPEALGEVSHASVIMPVDGSLPMQYNLSTSITPSSNVDFCNGLTVEAKLNGITKYNGPLSGLAYATTTTFGTWEFRFDLPPNVSVPNGVQCNASALFSAWRADIPNKADSSWHAEETLNISFTARMVVLNEIFARPNGGAAPKNKEYIELYNNGTTPVDTLGWQISEISGTTETFYPVVATGAVAGQMMPYNGASTIIAPGGFLVLQFGGGASHLNDSGDTVKLYDNSATPLLLDSHAYPAVSAGKSVVRFPDGIGYWVDPEATPGTENMVSMEDLKATGFDEATIAQILELAALKNVTLLDDNAENPIEIVPVVPVVPEVPAVLEVPVVPDILPPVPVDPIVIVPDILPPIILPPALRDGANVTGDTPVAVEPAPVISKPEPVLAPDPTTVSEPPADPVLPPDSTNSPQAEPAGEVTTS